MGVRSVQLISRLLSRSLLLPSFRHQSTSATALLRDFQPPTSVNRQFRSGQTVKHRSLGYEGAVLCSWNLLGDDGHGTNETATIVYGIVRDEAAVVDCTVTYLNDEGVVCGVRGIDYAVDTDLLPNPDANTAQLGALANKLLNSSPNGPSSTPNEEQPNTVLKSFVEQQWFRPNSMFVKTAEKYRISGLPFYLGASQGKHWWRCVLRIEHVDCEMIRPEAFTLKVISSSGAAISKTHDSIKQSQTPSAPLLHLTQHFALSCEEGGYISGEVVLANDKGERVFAQLPFIALKKQ